MAEASEPVVRCAQCLTVLAEPPNTPLAKRKPCAQCGSTGRNYAIHLSATLQVGGNLVQGAEAREAERSVYDVGYELQWLQLSEGGAWMLRVFDKDGNWIDGAVAEDPEEAILAVAERLLP
jgi:hypothetical protein